MFVVQKAQLIAQTIIFQNPYHAQLDKNCLLRLMHYQMPYLNIMYLGAAA